MAGTFSLTAMLKHMFGEAGWEAVKATFRKAAGSASDKIINRASEKFSDEHRKEVLALVLKMAHPKRLAFDAHYQRFHRQGLVAENRLATLLGQLWVAIKNDYKPLPEKLPDAQREMIAILEMMAGMSQGEFDRTLDFMEDNPIEAVVERVRQFLVHLDTGLNTVLKPIGDELKRANDDYWASMCKPSNARSNRSDRSGDGSNHKPNPPTFIKLLN